MTQWNGNFRVGWQWWCHSVNLLSADHIISYHIVRNVGGGKHWRIWWIDFWFAKLFLANVLLIRKINLTWSGWYNAKFAVWIWPAGILKYFRPVGSSLSSTTPTLPDPNGPLSERVPAKVIELTNAEVKQSWLSFFNIRTSVFKVYCWPATCIRRPKFLLDLPWTKLVIHQSFFCQCNILLIRQSFTPPTFCAIRYVI